MNTSARGSQRVAAAAVSVVALAAVATALFAPRPVRAQEPQGWRNATTGAPLKPGVYGRIVVKGDIAPPVIYREPVVANGAVGEVRGEPVYLYVPPGQVRKWKQNCARWSACDAPVLFVRVDDSPSRWGSWRVLREDVAVRGRD